jgi:hypothetical protein
MFIIEPDLEREMKILLRGLKQKMGQVPPHFEMFARVNPTRFKMFLEEITYVTTHPHINPDFFAFLRFFVASQNQFTYCIKFNHALLLSKGYGEEQLSMLKTSSHNLPLDDKHQSLFKEVIIALDEPSNFTASTLENLKALGWSDADIYDAVDHGAFLFKFSKIIRAYSKE